MNDKSSQSLPRNGRLISAGLAAAAAIGLLANHFTMESQNVVNLIILCLCPIGFFLGIGGMVEPKILWSVGKYGKHLPAIYKVIGGALGAMGVVVTVLMLLFVYRLGPPTRTPRPSLPNRIATTEKPKSSERLPASKPEHRVAPQQVMYLSYSRPNKRWEQMNEAGKQGVFREEAQEVTTLRYAEGDHTLLKVLWPDVLEIGDRFIVELEGANSIEMVDLEGADANARTSLPTVDGFVKVEIRREKDQIKFLCNGRPQNPYYASGKLRGDEAKAELLATSLRPGFSVKKGGQASFRYAEIINP
jgi:hypothetical protein